MKKIVTKPFDTAKVPPKQNLFFMPFIWIGCKIMTMSGKLKIEKVNMKGLKPPYLVLGTHHAFMDFYVTPLALFPRRANYVSELEGFEAYGEWLYRQVGCLGTRKFITDTNLVRNIKRVMERKGILVMYPEARYANVGTSSEIPISVSKLIKMLKVPVVVLNMQGNYLQSPIWNLTKRKGVPLRAKITQVFTKEQVQSMTKEEIHAVLREELAYDEYAWQEKERIPITFDKRAEGLHMPLYQCPICNKEHHMASMGSRLYCKNCGSEWEMDVYGRLVKTDNNKMSDNKINNNNIDIKEAYDKHTEGYDSGHIDTTVDFSHIPAWYEWQRRNVIARIAAGEYSLDMRVRIEALPNAINFIDCGEGRILHQKEGFYLTFKDYGQREEKTMFFSSKSLFSIHTEYDYRGKGQCITLSTDTNTYFIYPLEDGFNVTKIQFAVEELYSLKSKD